jgi:hypothetical protein
MSSAAACRGVWLVRSIAASPAKTWANAFVNGHCIVALVYGCFEDSVVIENTC